MLFNVAAKPAPLWKQMKLFTSSKARRHQMHLVSCGWKVLGMTRKWVCDLQTSLQFLGTKTRCIVWCLFDWELVKVLITKERVMISNSTKKLWCHVLITQEKAILSNFTTKIMVHANFFVYYQKGYTFNYS